MSSWAAIVARIKDRMQTVPDVGNVYEEIRTVGDQEQFGVIAVAEIGGEPKDRAWMISIEAADTSWLTHDGAADWQRQISIEGFFGMPEFVGGTEIPAMTVAEAVCAAIDSDIRATRLDGTVLHGGPCRLEANEPRVFGFVLCHYIKLVLPVQTVEER